MKSKHWFFNLIWMLVAAFVIVGIADNPLLQIVAARIPEKVVPVRTSQLNVFCVPVDTRDLIWTMKFDRRDFKQKVSLGYERIPHAKTEAEFAEIKEFAEKYIGVRYTPAGKNPSTGFDCSGFVLYVLSHCGSSLKSGSTEGQYENCYIVPEGLEKPGDIVFFVGTGLNPNSKAVSHVGIYLGDRKMIHAGNTGVAIVDLDSSYWPSHFLCFGRPFD